MLNGLQLQQISTNCFTKYYIVITDSQMFSPSWSKAITYCVYCLKANVLFVLQYMYIS